MNKKYVGIVAGLLLLAGCTNDDVFNEKGIENEGVKSFTTATATFSDEADTRAFLGAIDNSGVRRRVFWEGDEWIWLYSDTQPDIEAYYPDELKDNNTMTFKGNMVTGSKFYALFPAWDWEVDEQKTNIVHFLLNNWAVVDWDDFEFYPPMIAVSDDNNFAFKQVTTAIFVSISGIHRIKHVTLWGNQNETIGGNGYVDISKEQPSFVVDGSGKEYDSFFIDYSDEDGEIDSTEGSTKDIYFFIQPMTFEKGFTIEIEGYDEDGNEIHLTKTSSAKLKAKVATIHRFALVNVNAELEAIQATYGWTTGFENMNGKDALPVTYNVTSHPSTIEWNFTFVDDATLAQPNYQFEMQVTTDSEGIPSLDMLTSDNILSYKVRLIDNAHGMEFTESADNDGELTIGRNADGSWKIGIDGLSVTDVNDESHGSFFDFEFNGKLSLTEYVWTTNFSKLKGKDALAASYKVSPDDPTKLLWIFRFVDDATQAQPDYKIVMTAETNNPGGTPTFDMLTSLAVTDLHVTITDYLNGDIFEEPDNDDCEFKFSKNEDGTWRITAEDLIVSDVNNPMDNRLLDFMFNGELELKESGVPLYGWTTGWANFYGNDALPVSYLANFNAIEWSFTFVDDKEAVDPKYKILLTVETTNPGGNPTLDMLAGLDVTSIQLTIHDEADGSTWYRPANDDSEFVMTKDNDGIWSVTIEGLTVTNTQDENESRMLDFEYDGPLVLADSAN